MPPTSRPRPRPTAASAQRVRQPRRPGPSPSSCSIMPLLANGFFLIEIFGTTLILGIIALSLMFLAGYGGMVSLMQLTVAGLAGYMYAIFGVSGNTNISLGWPWWLATPIAIVLATLFGTRRRRARGAHRGHLHDHDHARDRRRRSTISPTRTTPSSTATPASTPSPRRISGASTGAPISRSTM